MSEISDEELKKLFKELEALDEVPRDVAARLDATVEKLAAAEKSKKSSRLTTTSWALAAGFTLVFGLGIVLNLDSSPISQTIDSSSSKPSEDNEDDVLTSIYVTNPYYNHIPQYSSGIDYSKEVFLKDFPFLPNSFSFYSLDGLSEELKSCLLSLGLEEINLVDAARYEGAKVKAVWSAIDGSSWQVFIIDDNCLGIDKVFISE